MTRASSVYVIMLLVFGGGLWLILLVGSTFLTAPPDLSGRWFLSDSPIADTQEFDPEDKSMAIEQSGKFLRLTFPETPPIDLKMQKPEPVRDGAIERTRLPLVGKTSNASIILDPTRKRMTLEHNGQTFFAIRAGERSKDVSPTTAPHASGSH
jgi:hypothetical protein